MYQRHDIANLSQDSPFKWGNSLYFKTFAKRLICFVTCPFNGQTWKRNVSTQKFQVLVRTRKVSMPNVLINVKHQC